MAATSQLLLLLTLATFANASTEGISLTSHTSVAAMRSVFYRSDQQHQLSMATITQSLKTTASAMKALETSNSTTPALIEITHTLHGQQSQLRKQKADPGYGGLNKAKDMLNSMIYESMTKYDMEISTCTGYYAAHCGEMEECRGQIAGSNYEAANSRMLILDAQSTINKCQVDIPTTKNELKKHEQDCALRLKRMSDRLKVLEGDLEVMTTILKMTDCDAKKQTLVQVEKLSLLNCQDPCTKASFITFNQDALRKQVSQLQSSVSHGLMQDGFKDLFGGINALEHVTEFLQLEQHQSPITNQKSSIKNQTKFNNPPLPRTEVPSNPCTDPDAGAPSQADKRAAKCTIKASPQCYQLQERFLLIQSGIQDDKDNLMEEIASVTSRCEESSSMLQEQIEDDEGRLDTASTGLAAAMTKEANAAESARVTAKRHEALDVDLKKQMKTCSTNYINYETEICALKKIRGELYKMKGAPQTKMFFQDCEVSKWISEACTKKCDGGEQKLMRNIMTHPSGGTKCLPLDATQKCNLQPCPVDCMLSPWRGWSKCSAECGGGVSQRLREVTVPMKHGGKPCGQTSQTKACNNQACEKDCELNSWTKWSACSKDCDGGSRKRTKFVKVPAEGAGKCPGRWSADRLEYMECNMQKCGLAAASQTLTCDKELDIVFLLDGSGSLGQKGWNAEIKAAETFVDSFSGSGAKAQMAVILYSGPRTWGGVYKCFGRNAKNVDMEGTCKIKSVNHFSNKMSDIKANIKALKWPQGSTLTSLALLAAKSELSLGRKSAQSIVVVITDGRPLSFRATYYAARSVRKSARLVWVPVTRYAPLAFIKHLATRRWQENIVQVKTFDDLENPDIVSHVVANICPMHELM